MKYLFTLLVVSLPLFAKDLGPILYNSCQYCHGKFGEKEYADTVPAINQWDKETLVEMLKLYKKGELDSYGFGPIMKQQMKNMPLDKIPTLATYITNLKKEKK